MEEKREGPIGYRPSEEMKKIFDKYCSGKASISRGQLVEVAMQYLVSEGQEKMEEVIMNFLLNKKPEAKKGDHRKSA